MIVIVIEAVEEERSVERRTGERKKKNDAEQRTMYLYSARVCVVRLAERLTSHRLKVMNVRCTHL